MLRMPHARSAAATTCDMFIQRHLLIALFVIVLALPAVQARDYEFDGKISRPVLENYLSRSITMLDLLTGKASIGTTPILEAKPLHRATVRKRPSS